MKIVSWSPFHGNGITINTALLAAYTAIKKEKSILALDSQLRYGRLQDILKKDSENGINEIITFAMTKNLSPEKFKIYASSVVENRLYILGAPKNNYMGDQMHGCYDEILKKADTAFDHVFIDTNSGIYNEITNTVLEAADIIIVNLPQDDYILESFFGKEEGVWHKVLDSKYVVYVIGNFDKEFSHYPINKIKRRYKIKNMYPIPRNKELHKAVNENSFITWFKSSYEADKKDYNIQLFNSLENIYGAILGKPENRGFLNFLKKEVS